MAGEETNERASLKDVYAISGRVEVKLDGLAAKFDAVTVHNEHRFTKLEVNQDSHGRRLGDLETVVTTIQNQIDKDEAATAALQSARERSVDWRHWAVGTLLTIGIILASVLPWILN